MCLTLLITTGTTGVLGAASFGKHVHSRLVPRHWFTVINCGTLTLIRGKEVAVTNLFSILFCPFYSLIVFCSLPSKKSETLIISAFKKGSFLLRLYRIVSLHSVFKGNRYMLCLQKLMLSIRQDT